MAETSKKKWIDVFKDNYNGTSDIAKEIEPFVKENYKGNSYVPWATMERLTYMCDPDATFENIKNENGGLVHTDVMNMDQVNIQKGETVSETHSQMFAHFVKVRLYFMNKEFIEEYPIQDQDYSAARVFNQNLVNRALQRAKAKVASRATGLGFKLYEGKDLQFDEVPVETKPEIPVVEVKEAPKKETKSNTKVEKTVEKVEEKPVETQSNVETKVETTPVVETKTNDAVEEAIKIIKTTDKEKMNLALQKVNVALMKKHQIALSTESSDDELRNILSNENIFKDPSQFLKTLNTLLG